MLQRPMLWPFVLAALSSCAGSATPSAEAPGISFPTTVGEGAGDPDQQAGARTAPARPESATPAAEPGELLDEATKRRRAHGSLPDPPPLSLESQWQLSLKYERGELHLVEAVKREFDTPITTARRMGRFAVELWIGHELIDRVRFNFPLVVEQARSDRRQALDSPVELAPGATSTQTVLVPDSPRATRAVLVDRATGREAPLPWPPDRPGGPQPDSPRSSETGK